MPPCSTGQLPVCACGWNFMSLREARLCPVWEPELAGLLTWADTYSKGELGAGSAWAAPTQSVGGEAGLFW